SLRLSDRKKASLVARRLNALLLQVELIPAARMATKEQLKRIFALEIEEIEALDRAAKHLSGHCCPDIQGRTSPRLQTLAPERRAQQLQLRPRATHALPAPSPHG